MATEPDEIINDRTNTLGGRDTPAAQPSNTYPTREQHPSSSPLLKDSSSRGPQYHNSKFRNSISSFRLSKDLANIRWDGRELKEDDISFKDTEGYSSNDDDTEDGTDSDNEEIGTEHRPGSKDASDAAQYSTISKRADLILANAKKRLNLLEGNLGKARHSLVSPQAVYELRTQSSLSSYPSTDDEDRSVRIRPRINFAPSRRGRAPPAIRKPSPGHSRMYSDTSVPSPSGNSIKGSRSLDHLSAEKMPSPLHEGREFEELGAASEDSLPTRIQKVQPVESSDTAEDDTGTEKRQSTHTTRELLAANSPAPKSTQELRDQADELRSRIAFLQKRAQSNSTPGDDPSAERNDNLFQTQVDALQRSLEDQESVIEQLETAERERSQALQDDPRGEWQQVLEQSGERGSGSEFSEDEYDEYDDEDAPDALVEEDLDETKSMRGAHEDRDDAFDYEHFILHSGMVLPTTTDSGSQSSAPSHRTASTERGLHGNGMAGDQAFPGTVESWEGLQQANDSIASLTTMQSFETAAEVNDSSSDLGSDASDMQHEELLQTGRLQDPWPMPPAVNADGRRAAFRESQVATPTAATFSKPARRSSGLGVDASLRPVSAVVMSLMKRERDGLESRALESQDEELVRSTAESLRRVCQDLTLRETSHSDMQALRERLEVANRVLRGEL